MQPRNLTLEEKHIAAQLWCTPEEFCAAADDLEQDPNVGARDRAAAMAIGRTPEQFMQAAIDRARRAG